MEQKLIKEMKGLFTHMNPIYGVPDGALQIAENVFINREFMLEKSRGFNRYGAVTASLISQLFEFKGKVLRLQGSTLSKDDGTGTFTNFTGTFTPGTRKSRSIEAGGSVYMTIGDKVWKLDSLTNNPIKPGMPPAVDTNLTMTGTGNGWFTLDTQVGYKICWMRKDANNKEVRGEPSVVQEIITNASKAAAITSVTTTATVTLVGHGFTSLDYVIIKGVDTTTASNAYYNGTFQVTVTGPDTFTYTMGGSPATTPAPGSPKAGKNEEVTVQFTIPSGVQVGDYYEVYRSEISLDATTTPFDDVYKLYFDKVVAGDLVTGYIEFDDIYEEAFLGTDLYTNTTQETITQANSVPPFCKDLAFYKGYTFFGNTYVEHYLDLQLIGVAGLTNGNTVSIVTNTGTHTYTMGAAENAGTRTFKLTTTELTSAKNVELTAKSLCKMINRDSGNTEYYARYASSASEAPGYILINMRQHITSGFSMKASAAGVGDNFQPILPTTGTSVSSQNDANVSMLKWAKMDQTDSVPGINNKPIGVDVNDPIERIVANRDSLFIFKRKEGVFRLSGEGIVEQMGLKILDSTANIIASDSACLVENAIYLVSTQGVVKVDESGTAIISRQIETEFKKLFAYNNFSTLCFGLGYESERQYWVFTQSANSDTYCTQAWVFNYLTNTWTTRIKPVSCALTLSYDDKMYLGHAVDKFVLKERKSYGTLLNDYMEEDISITITAVTSTYIDLTYAYTTVALDDGFMLTQGINQSIITSVTSLGGTSYRITLLGDDENYFVNGASVITIGVNSRVRWMPQACGNIAALKEFPVVQIYLEYDTATSVEFGFYSDDLPTLTYVDPITFGTQGFGLSEWGEGDWGDEGIRTSTPERVYVPQEFVCCRALTLEFTHKVAQETFALAGLAYEFRTVSARTARNK